MAGNPKSLKDVMYLLEKADLLVKKAKKKEKVVKTCERCDKPQKYRGLCEDHLQEDRNERHSKTEGKRWFSSNGHEYTYGPEGKVILYSTHRMTQLLGRPLQEFESVGRLDGDKRNNEDDNLILICKPGINLLALRCSCGLPYFDKGASISGLPQE